MLAAFSQAIEQLGDPAFRRVFWRGILGALAAFIAAYYVTKYGFALLDALDFGFIDKWVNFILTWAFWPVFMIASYFLFPPLATAIMAIFLDDIVDAVEDRHYPQYRAPYRLGFWVGLLMAVRLAGAVLLWNILALPLYIILMFTVIGPAILFFILNGYLLGREYLELVAARHIPPGQIAHFRQTHRSDLFTLGAAVTLLFMLPIVNLFAPIIGAAMAVHVFHHAADKGMRYVSR